MDPDHLSIERLTRATRSLSRAATAVKVICVIAFFFAAGFFLYGLSRIDHGDDIIAFSLLALGIAAIALIFWSIVSFHTASVHGMALLGSLHGKLDALLGAMAAGAAQANEAAARRARVRPRGDAAPALESAGDLGSEARNEVSGVVAAPFARPATTGGADLGAAPSALALDVTEVAPAAPTVASRAPVAAAPAREPQPEPEPEKAKPVPRPSPTDGVDTKACRTCGSEIRADATRCRWCMKAA